MHSFGALRITDSTLGVPLTCKTGGAAVRIAPAMLAIASVFVAVLAAPITGTAQSVAAADGHCTDWKSTTNPPPSIAVYRVSEGRVERVDFKTYVIRVSSREWNIDAAALRRAGVVAVKQYAWYHVLHYRGGKFNGKCFDVKDTTADQLYASKSLSSDTQPDQARRQRHLVVAPHARWQVPHDRLPTGTEGRRARPTPASGSTSSRPSAAPTRVGRRADPAGLLHGQPVPVVDIRTLP